MKTYSFFYLISNALIRFGISIWAISRGSDYFLVPLWNHQLAFLLCLSIIPMLILTIPSSHPYGVPLIFVDFLIIGLAVFPLRSYIGIPILLMSSHYWVMTHRMEKPWSYFYVVGGVVLYQIFSGPALISGKMQPGPSILFRISIFAGQMAAAALVILQDEIGCRSDKAFEDVEFYKGVLSDLLERNLDLQDYAMREKDTVRETERKRIAGELHDSLMHSLLNLKMSIESMKDFLPNPKPELQRVMRVSETIMDSIWESIEKEIYDINDTREIEKVGINRLHELVKTFSDATSIKVSIENGNFPVSLGADLDRTVFRVIQEGLTNAFRHGKANFIEILLWKEKNAYRMVIRDNGMGSAVGTQSGMGLWGIRERLSAVNGSVEFHSFSTGFEISATIPVNGSRT